VIDVTEAESLPLDARVIEAGLGRLWQMAAEGTPGGVVHTSSLTLLVVLADQAAAAREEAVLAQVGPAHPCRAILLVPNGSEPRARLGAYCRPPRSGRPPTCWEEIRLEGSRTVLQRVLSVAAQLVLPNLPAQVWWPGNPELEGPLFQRLVEIGDRLIVDSGQFLNPLASLARYADRSNEEHGTVGFVDLGWRRLEPWRLLTAQFFDEPSDRVFLNDVKSIEVGYEQPSDGLPSGLAAALLVVGWLASRLGWTPRQSAPAGKIRELVFDDGGREILVRLRSYPMVESLARLVSLELRASHDGESALYALERRGGRVTTVAEVNGVRREAQVHLPTASQAELLQRELGGFGRDRIYEDALRVVRLLAGAEGTP
jgi:glucose-6-phosphate dehydrogenase assembly protein OpcA